MKINNLRINLNHISKKVKNFFIEHKLVSVGGTAAILLVCVTFIVSYAYYKIVAPDPIVGSIVGDIPDLDIRIMVEDRDESGTAIGTYSLYPYIPQAGYEYNSTDSYCVNGSTLKYNANNHTLSVDTEGIETCYAYFDSIANLDIILNVHVEDTNEEGKGLGTYTVFYDDSVPLVGYKFDQTRSTCTNDATISYNIDTGRFVILTNNKTVCNAWMDAVEPDILLNTWVEKTKGAKDYVQVKEIPSNKYYTLATTGDKTSQCTGGASLQLVDQQIVIKATAKTRCVAYLDLADGPIVESSSISINNMGAKLFMSPSPVGKGINKYYYSLDDGNTYTETPDGNINGEIKDKVLVYGVDEAGNHSNVVEMDKDNNYFYNGFFEDSTKEVERNIEMEGYYYIQAWGASESNQFNLGSYAEGKIYLNASDKLYIKVGAMPSGDSTVKVNVNDDNHRVIIAGGASASYILTKDTANNYPGINNLDAKYYMTDAMAYSKYDLFASPVAGNEAGHAGNGYIKITYVGKTAE